MPEKALRKLILIQKGILIVSLKITVVGSGYVGMSNAVLLAQYNQVKMLDIVQERVDLINENKSPIKDEKIEEYLSNKKLNIKATMSKDEAYSDADYIIIATPTNYDVESKYFDTKSIEIVADDVARINPNAIMIIKSTIPVGFVNDLKMKVGSENIIFSPEFLREGMALHDNLFPSRIVIGENSERAKKFASILLQGAIKEDIDIVYTDSKEAEAIKLFANTYLAMRVAYINELDTYAELNNLNSKQILDGMCLDPRIGMNYNNPSFGYGGYCLPKDTKQLLANFEGIPSNLIESIINSNLTRKKHIADQVKKLKPNKIGIYRLIMKTGSDNFRESAVHDIIKMIGYDKSMVAIYEPTIKKGTYDGYKVYQNLENFKADCDIIISNRVDENLKEVKHKVYTRDVYSKD